MHALEPREPVDAYAMLFVAAVIRHERFRYTYGYKWTLERMNASRLRLPATPHGEPDWELMSAYMRSLPYATAVDQHLTTLRTDRVGDRAA